MSVERVAARLVIQRLRVDVSAPEGPARGVGPVLAVIALAAGFVLAWGSRLELGPEEARLGMAAGEGLGPYGQVFGGWDPALWPAPVLLGQAWAWASDEGVPSAGAVRWPAACAGVLIGLILARRLGAAAGGRAAVLAGLCTFGSLALMDRSSGLGLDLLTGLGTVGALDRILSKRADAVAGLWAALALLTGGWPPLAIIGLATIVLGRPGAVPTWRSLVPIAAALAAWSAWALASAPAEAWAAALTLPLTSRPAWTLAPEVIAAGLPWSPLAALWCSKRVRGSGSGPAADLVRGWMQVVGAALLAGTLIPGLAPAARVTALAGLAVTAAWVADRAWSGALSTGARRTLLGLALVVCLIWAAAVIPMGSYIAAAVPYYRGLTIALVLLAGATLSVALAASWAGQPRWAIGAVAAVAVGLKLAHAGVYAPEWNYRFGQGPWGRAIGQWVPPRWPIYTTHAWPADLAFATGRHVRQLADPKLLKYEPADHPQFVLLLPSEFEHWPASAPKLIEVRRFLDEHGRGRVLARTEGDLYHERQGGED